MNLARPMNDMDKIRIQVVYDGIGPAIWTPTPNAFGIQDKDENLFPGKAGAMGTVIFDVTLQVKPGSSTNPTLAGPFAHGPAAKRFLYLSWRSPAGNYAQRLKLPLSSIGWDLIRDANSRNLPIVGRLVDHHPRATTTGANIGGTRAIDWTLP